MEIRFYKHFEKRFKKLPLKFKEKTISAIQRFAKNPFDPFLRNHALAGKLRGRRAFSVMGDIRIIFEEHKNYIIVIFLDIGDHNQVYP